MTDYNKKQQKTKKIARIMALVLAVAMIASSGFYLLMLFGGSSVADSFTGSVAYGSDFGLTEEQQFRVDSIEEIMWYITEYYKDEVDYDRLIEGMYNGMLESLNDPWSEYYFAGDSTASSITVELESEFYGIGVSVTKDDNGFLITEVMPQGAAKDAGLKGGDYIVSIDGENVRGLDLTQLTMKLRGKNNTKVKIGIKRGTAVTEYTLTRRKVVNSSLSCKLLEGTTLGYIDIDSFSSTTAKEFEDARRELLVQGITGLIIDLRSNGGGYIDQAWDIADQLMDGGVIGYYMSQGEIIETIRASESVVREVPVVVLTDEYTASASEALAAALKDSKTATIVGEVTYGKGVAQTQTDVVNGDNIKLSILYFMGSSRYAIQGFGVVPNYIVYSYGDYTASQAQEINSKVVPIDPNARCYAGDWGINVLAAQQRLCYLGYDVEPTGIMDEKTMEALRRVQRASGSYSYGNLDNFTLNALNEQFLALFGADKNGQRVGDPQLEKAIELLTK